METFVTDSDLGETRIELDYEAAVSEQDALTVPFSLSAVFRPSESRKKIPFSAFGVVVINAEGALTDCAVTAIEIEERKRAEIRAVDDADLRFEIERAMRSAASHPDSRRFFQPQRADYQCVRLRVECVVIDQYNSPPPYLKQFTAVRYLPRSANPEQFKRALPALLFSLTEQARQRFQHAHFVGIWDAHIISSSDIDARSRF